MGSAGDAGFWAEQRVADARRGPAERFELVHRLYRGGSVRAPPHLPFERAQLSFMRWQAGRGLLAAPDADPPGSAWWRALNDGLLRDGCEAVAISRGLARRPSSPVVGWWMDFIAAPTAQHWYRAHNASIVAGYLTHQALAAQETAAERFFMNVVLIRVLYAHALVSAPALALGRLAPLGPLLGDPRLGMAGAFLSLRRVIPDRYPLARDVRAYVSDELALGRLLDFGVIVPRLRRLYEWSAAELGETRLLGLLEDGRPAYGGAGADRQVWERADRTRLERLIGRLTAAAGTPGSR